MSHHRLDLLHRTAPRRCIVALIALALLVQLAGCTVVGPSFQTPQAALPDTWTQARAAAPGAALGDDASAALPADRWAVFQQPELLRLQDLALQANQEVKTALLRLLQSRVNETTVSAQRGPRLDARGGAARQRQSESGSATRVAGALGGAAEQQLIKVLSDPFALYQAGFDASWEPDLWGRVARSEEAARAGSDAQQAALRQVQLSLVAEVARQYFRLRSVQQQRQFTRDELVVAQDVEQVLLAQHQGGMADESALVRQRTIVAALEAVLPALGAQEAQAMNQIALLCAAKPGDLRDELDASRVMAEAVPLPDLRLGLPSEMVRNRPDLVAAQASLHAATAMIGLAVADLYPRIMLGASFGTETVDAAKFGEWGARQWSVGASLSIPIFDQGRRRSLVTLRELQQQQSAVAYQQTVLKAWHEVDDAISNYLTESLRGVQLERKVGLTKDEGQLVRARFAGGMTNYLPLASAEMALLEARRELSDSRARVNTALVAIYKALGDDAGAGPLAAE